MNWAANWTEWKKRIEKRAKSVPEDIRECAGALLSVFCSRAQEMLLAWLISLIAWGRSKFNTWPLDSARKSSGSRASRQGALTGSPRCACPGQVPLVSPTPGTCTSLLDSMVIVKLPKQPSDSDPVPYSLAMREENATSKGLRGFIRKATGALF